MRLPIVSRASHEETIALWRRLADTEHENAQQLRRDLTDVTARLFAALTQGPATISTVAGQVFTSPVTRDIAQSVDPVRQVIREQVRANKGMAGLDGYLWDYARQLRDERNMSPNEIAAALLKWDSSETLSEPVDSVVPIVGEDAA